MPFVEPEADRSRTYSDEIGSAMASMMKMRMEKNSLRLVMKATMRARRMMRMKMTVRRMMTKQLYEHTHSQPAS